MGTPALLDTTILGNCLALLSDSQVYTLMKLTPVAQETCIRIFKVLFKIGTNANNYLATLKQYVKLVYSEKDD